MTPIYDSRGRATAWMGSRGRIIGRSGRVFGYVTRGGNVFDMRGRHLGWWRDGHMRGHDGGVMCWTRGARGLRVTPPIVGDTPLAPGFALSAEPSITDTPPLKPPQRFAWSRSSL